MTQSTRERALEAALRAIMEHPRSSDECVVFMPREVNAAKAALSLPSSPPDADMLAALRDVRAMLAHAQSSGDDGLAEHIAQIDRAIPRHR